MLREAPAAIRARIPHQRMTRIWRWVLIFVVGFYLGQITAKPAKIEAIQTQFTKGD